MMVGREGAREKMSSEQRNPSDCEKKKHISFYYKVPKPLINRGLEAREKK